MVLFHAFPDLLPGGFVGVDIFFVISGYLITDIIIESQARGCFKLGEFYARRIKRIFPALILVIGCCLLVGWRVLMPDEYKRLGQHALAGAAYVSNFLLLTETGYFDVASESKPFLHLWSLSIEEQFYLAWPLVLVIAMRKKFDTHKLTVWLLLAAFALNLVTVEIWPSSSFYSPVSRSWELLIGALLAHLNFQNQGNAPGNPNLLAFTGVALIAWALMESSAGMPLPGWWALFPTLGAACLIASGGRAWINRRLLAARLPVFIGLISYPLYLWHWPLLSLARIVESRTPDLTVRMAVIALSLALAWATYRFVERPVRATNSMKLPAGLVAGLVFVGVAGFQIHSHAGFPKPGAITSEGEARFSNSLSWQKAGWASSPECRELFGEEFHDFCVVHDPKRKPTAILLGDSNANHFFPGLSAVYAKDEINLLNLGKAGCPPLMDIDVVMRDGNLNCKAATEKALDYAVGEASVQTVVLSMLGVGYATGRRSATLNATNFIRISSATDSTLTTNLAILEHSMRLTLTRLSATNKRIVLFVSVPMLDFDPSACVDFRPWRISPARLKTPCAIPQGKVDELSAPFHLMVARVAKDFPKVKVLDSARELCDGENCWAQKEGKLLYRDPEHLSVDGSKYLAERLMAKLTQTPAVRP